MEMGLSDVPAFIDFILGKTGLENLSYIGHSQGTTQLFLGGALNPTYYKDKINLFIALAPVASTEHLGVKALRAAANHIKVLEFVMTHKLSLYSWFPPVSLGSEAIDTFCVLEPAVCTSLMSELFDPEIDNISR